MAWTKKQPQQQQPQQQQQPPQQHCSSSSSSSSNSSNNINSFSNSSTAAAGSSSSSNSNSNTSINSSSSSNRSSISNAEMLKGKKRLLMLRVKKTLMNNMLLKKTRAKLWKGSWPKPGAELAALSLGSMEAVEGVALQSTPEKRRVQVVGNEVGSTEKDVTLVKMQDRCNAMPKQGLEKHKRTHCTNISKPNYSYTYNKYNNQQTHSTTFKQLLTHAMPFNDI